MIISCTGYRPFPKLGGFILPNSTYNYVCQQTEKILKELNPTKCMSGVCIGYDSYFINVCLQLGIPYIAICPFLGQEKMWPGKTQKIYHKLLNKAESVIIVSEGEYSAAKMQIRNKFLVDNCNILISCMRQDETSGGTFNCVSYAKSVNRKIINIDPSTTI